MRAQNLVVLVALCVFIPTVAMADSIDSITPGLIYAGNVEEFLTITGTGLLGSESTAVEFIGPAGSFTVESQGGDQEATGRILYSWIPLPVLFSAGTYQVRVLATDIGGQTRVIGPGSFVVAERPLDGPPQLIMPEIIVAETDSRGGANVEFAVSAISDNGQPAVVTCDRQPGSRFPLGTTTVHCTAIDSFGNTTGDFLVAVVDTVRPTMVLPANITTANPVVEFTATANDILDGDLAVVCNPASGSTFPLGVTIVACYAEDASFNIVNGSFKVTVLGGEQAPELVLPADITKEATGAAGAVVSYVATATGGEPVTCTPASGSTFALGQTTVQCSASNGGGTTNGSFKVTVVDTTAPALTLPANIVREATSLSGAVVSFVTSATDIVDGSRPVTCTPPSGSTFAMGTTTVQCNTSDTRGNTAVGSFTITVRDTTPPSIFSIAASPSSLWPPNHQMVTVNVTVGAVDLPGATLISRVISVSSSQPINGTGDGDTSPDWVLGSGLSVQLRSERSQGVDRVYTLTVETVDQSGNTARATVDVKVTQGKSRAAR
jgi:hypothetical protein